MKFLQKATPLVLAAAAILPLAALTTNEAQAYRSLTVTDTHGRQYGCNIQPFMDPSFDDEANFTIRIHEMDENGMWTTNPETGQYIFKTLITMPGLEIASIEFSNELSSVSTVSDLEFIFSYDPDSKILSVTGGEEHHIEIISLSGMVEDILTTGNTATVDMGRYGSGIHIVKIDSQTIKLLVK